MQMSVDIGNADDVGLRGDHSNWASPNGKESVVAGSKALPEQQNGENLLHLTDSSDDYASDYYDGADGVSAEMKPPKNPPDLVSASDVARDAEIAAGLQALELDDRDGGVGVQDADADAVVSEYSYDSVGSESSQDEL